MDTKQLQLAKKSTVSGEISDLDESYGRFFAVPWLILLPTLVFAMLGNIPFMIVSLIRRKPAFNWAAELDIRAMRKGPEIPITPIWIRPESGKTIEAEVQGYLQSDRLILNDRVEVDLVRQRPKGWPPRALRISNITTGQLIRPHPNTIWGHLGLGMLLQAATGVGVAILLVVAWIAGGRV